MTPEPTNQSPDDGRDEGREAPGAGPDGGATPGAPIDPTTERLFEFAGPAWVDRLRRSQEQPALGRLGAYEVLSVLGRGGQGEVYKAIQPGTRRTVALKRVAGLGLSPDASVLARFTREVQALVRLADPCVVTVHGVEVIDGHSIIIMEYVDGKPIDAWADEQWALGDRPLPRVLDTFIAVCSGVSHAHKRGVLHRDIKPSNVLVTADHLPKVLDFGIARLLNAQAHAGADVRWSVTGFAGTPMYAAPENATVGATNVDTRSDVFSLGVMLYRMLAGRDPWDPALGLPGLLRAAEAGPAPGPSKARRGLPREADWIVRRATEPDPHRRYQTVDALADDVQRLRDGRAVLAVPPSAWYLLRRAIARRPWRSAVIAGASLVIISLGLTAVVQAVRLSARASQLSAALSDAEQARDRAARALQRSDIFNRRLLDAATGAVNHATYFFSTDPKPLTTLRRLVDDLSDDDPPETRLTLRMRLGFALYQARDYAGAERELAAAQAISELVDQPTGERLCWILLERARCLTLVKKHEERLRLLEAAIERAAASPATIYSAMLHWSRAHGLHNLGRPAAESLAAAEDAIRRADEHTERRFERAKVREELTVIARDHARDDLVARWYADALRIALEDPTDPPTISRLQYSCAEAHMRRGEWAEAEPLLRETVAYRVRIETAGGNRAHRFLVSHALTLHRLGRYPEAAAAWERALVRPLGAARRDERRIAQLRVRLAAALFAAGEHDAARVSLALAISRGGTASPTAPAVAEQSRRLEEALRASAWQVDDVPPASIGDLLWIRDKQTRVESTTEP